MTNFDWAKLGVKLLGLWLVISAVISAANVASVFQFDQFRASRGFFSFGYVLFEGIIGLSIWSRSDWVASRIFPVVLAPDNPLAGSQPEQLFVLAVSFFGVVLISNAVTRVAYEVTLFVISRGSMYQSVFGPISYPDGEQARIWSATAKADTVAAVVRGFIGFGLLLGATRISELAASLRGTRGLRD